MQQSHGKPGYAKPSAHHPPAPWSPGARFLLAALIFMAGMMLGSIRPLLGPQQQPEPVVLSAPQQPQQPPSPLLAATAAPAGGAAASSPRTIYESDLSSLARLNAHIIKRTLEVEACEPVEFGQGWGAHHLCTKKPPTQPCHFYSFGVSSDYSFDRAVADTWGCTGFAADPTVVHNSTLLPGVTFHNIAANSPWATTNAAANKWLHTSVPGLRAWLKHERIAVLKLDCEGCEYSIAADVLAEEPAFFTRVEQLAVEVHWSRMWLKGRDEMYALASLLDLLEEAGLQLVHMDLTPCGAFAARTGLLPELSSHMTSLFEADAPQRHCQNYLFARL